MISCSPRHVLRHAHARARVPSLSKLVFTLEHLLTCMLHVCLILEPHDFLVVGFAGDVDIARAGADCTEGVVQRWVERQADGPVSTTRTPTVRTYCPPVYAIRADMVVSDINACRRHKDSPKQFF